VSQIDKTPLGGPRRASVALAHSALSAIVHRGLRHSIRLARPLHDHGVTLKHGCEQDADDPKTWRLHPGPQICRAPVAEGDLCLVLETWRWSDDGRDVLFMLDAPPEQRRALARRDDPTAVAWRRPEHMPLEDVRWALQITSVRPQPLQEVPTDLLNVVCNAVGVDVARQGMRGVRRALSPLLGARPDAALNPWVFDLDDIRIDA
jgi:hypothetical protein